MSTPISTPPCAYRCPVLGIPLDASADYPEEKLVRLIAERGRSGDLPGILERCRRRGHLPGIEAGNPARKTLKNSVIAACARCCIRHATTPAATPASEEGRAGACGSSGAVPNQARPKEGSACKKRASINQLLFEGCYGGERMVASEICFCCPKTGLRPSRRGLPRRPEPTAKWRLRSPSGTPISAGPAPAPCQRVSPRDHGRKGFRAPWNPRPKGDFRSPSGHPSTRLAQPVLRQRSAVG